MSIDAGEPAGSFAIPDLATLLDQLAGTPSTPAAALAPSGAPQPEPDDPQAAAGPVFDNLDAFISGYLAPVVERRVVQGASPGVAWCPEWWRHPEAISRLYALWRGWETLRVADPGTGMSLWWRDHFDPHFAVLTSDHGPLGKCSPDRGHVATAALPVVPAPPEVLAQLPDA